MTLFKVDIVTSIQARMWVSAICLIQPNWVQFYDIRMCNKYIGKYVHAMK